MPLTTRLSVKKVQQNLPTLSSSSNSVAQEHEVPVTRCENPVEDVFLFSHQNENPMMNHLVLSTLFGYVKPEDLLVCRLVCKMWNVMALPSVRAKCKVTIQELDHSKLGNQRWISWDYINGGIIHRTQNRNIYAFVKLMRSNTMGIPFSKLNWEAYRGIERTKKMFLRLCGDTIKEMDLSNCNLFLSHLSDILCNVPNLECFKTPKTLNRLPDNPVDVKLFPEDANPRPRLPRLNTLCIVEGLASEEVFRVLLKDLFQTAERISNIVLMEDDNFHLPYNYDLVLEVLNVIESTGRESRIENLTVPNITEASLDVLRRVITKKNGLKLKKVMIKNGLENDQWFHFVNLCKDDLIELSSGKKSRRWRIYSTAAPVFELPVMKKLKLLEIALGPGRSNLLSCNLKNAFPVLEKLSVWNHPGAGAVNANELFTEDEPCSNIESLCLKKIPMDTKIIDRIALKFPDLRKVQLKVMFDGGLNIVKTLFMEMTQLEELDLKVGKRTDLKIDSMMTGIPSYECQEMKSRIGYLDSFHRMSKEVRIAKILELTDKLRANPSIVNLSKLRRLRLRLPHDGGHVSDVTGYLALLPLKFLKHISMDMCKLSENCCKLLVAEMELESWEFINCSRWKRKYEMDNAGLHIIPRKLYPYVD